MGNAPTICNIQRGTSKACAHCSGAWMVAAPAGTRYSLAIPDQTTARRWRSRRPRLRRHRRAVSHATVHDERQPRSATTDTTMARSTLVRAGAEAPRCTAAATATAISRPSRGVVGPFKGEETSPEHSSKTDLRAVRSCKGDAVEHLWRHGCHKSECRPAPRPGERQQTGPECEQQRADDGDGNPHDVEARRAVERSSDRSHDP